VWQSLLLHPIQQSQTPWSPLSQCGLRNDLMLARAKNVVPCLCCTLGPTRLYFFYFTKNVYTYIFNIKNIWARCSTGQTTSLSVSRPYSITAWIRTPPPASFFNILRWFNQMSRWSNGLTQHSLQAIMTCLGQSCGPRSSDPCQAAIWPSIDV
jgi:hypothetical protein